MHQRQAEQARASQRGEPAGTLPGRVAARCTEISLIPLVVPPERVSGTRENQGYSAINCSSVRPMAAGLRSSIQVPLQVRLTVGEWRLRCDFELRDDQVAILVLLHHLYAQRGT